jgi:tRNA(adenine34) deaminase
MDMGKTSASFMKQALGLAAEALESGEFRTASIVVLDGRVMSKAMASEQRERFYLGHAELVSLEEADRQGLSFAKCRDAKMFTTLERHLMCMGAAMPFFLGDIYYALESPGDGAVDVINKWDRREDDIPGYHPTRSQGSCCERKASGSLRGTYRCDHQVPCGNGRRPLHDCGEPHLGGGAR